MGWGNTKEAALACGLPVQSWRGWERDNRSPRDYIDVCQKIAKHTGCDLYWLAGLPRLDSNQQPFGYQHRDAAVCQLPARAPLGDAA